MLYQSLQLIALPVGILGAGLAFWSGWLWTPKEVPDSFQRRSRALTLLMFATSSGLFVAFFEGVLLYQYDSPPDLWRVMFTALIFAFTPFVALFGVFALGRYAQELCSKRSGA